MSKNKEIKNIERLEMMEEKFGVSLDGLYAKYENGNLIVNGEIQSENGTTIGETIFLIMTAYNADGKVIATKESLYLADKFLW